MSLPIVRKKNPFIHCITNEVVANFQANGLLAIGASPAMASAREEVEEFTAQANALSLNIGTLTGELPQAMLLAGKAANRHNVPIVLDPVGVGASRYRQETINKFLNTLTIDVLRCNQGELATIAGVSWQAKGVDSGSGTMDVVGVAKAVAKKHHCIVAVTDVIDIVTDGTQSKEIIGGSNLAPMVTGSGCLLSAIVAAGLATNRIKPNLSEAYTITCAILQDYKKAAELAAKKTQSPGSFKTFFLDTLYQLSLG